MTMSSQMLSLFKKDLPSDLGELLLVSELKGEEMEESVEARAYRTGVMIGKVFMKYHFDLRFAVDENTLTIDYKDEELVWELPLRDSLKWRAVLRQFLNQKGFHEQFRPIKKIGKGNFASVYLVEKIEDNSRYAVKAFSKEAAYSQENGKECLIKEIQIMRNLNNPNTMRLYEVFESDNSLYIVFELLEGGQLQSRLKVNHFLIQSKQKFTPKQVKTMVRGLLEGLREMHSKNIMHRDLKPQNILFRKEGDYDCVIADYGLAEFSNIEEYLFVRCGTPGFVAPEVINIKDMKTRYSLICDIFSLGLIFHLMVFGKSVFKGRTYNEVLAENRACNFKFTTVEYERADREIMDLLCKMLAINPQERISADQALKHPYFKDEDEEDEEERKANEEELADGVKENCFPPLDVREKLVKKDSCLTFKLNKDTVFTGKTEAVQSSGTKTSMFGLGLLNGVGKVSKFVRTPFDKQPTQSAQQVQKAN